MESKEYILDNLEEILSLSIEEFNRLYKKQAFEILKKNNKGQVMVSGLLAISNVCKNNCTYCGLRRGRKINRFSLEVDIAKKAIKHIKEMGLKQILFISGESNSIKLKDYLNLIEYAKELNLYVNMAGGVFQKEDYKKMKYAGLDQYTLKFETSNKNIFNKIKPDISYNERLEAIESIREVGLDLGSGNIVGLEGQTLKDVVEDIKLMNKLNIRWAPIVPYLPAPNTPMAENTKMGDVDLTLKVISIIRILLEEAYITAGQPKKGSNLGFADPEGNTKGLEYGGNIFFVDITPNAVKNEFNITKNRKLPRLEEINKIVNKLDLSLDVEERE
jgi:biotin synthase